MKNPFLNTADYAIAKEVKRINEKKELVQSLNSLSKRSLHHLSQPIFVTTTAFQFHDKKNQILKINNSDQYLGNCKSFSLNLQKKRIKLYEVEQLQYQPFQLNRAFKLPIKNVYPYKSIQEMSLNKNENFTLMDIFQQNQVNTSFDHYTKLNFSQEKISDCDSKQSLKLNIENSSNEYSNSQKQMPNSVSIQKEQVKKDTHTLASQIQPIFSPDNDQLSFYHSPPKIAKNINSSFAKIIEKNNQNQQYNNQKQQENNYEQTTTNENKKTNRKIPLLINVRDKIFYHNLCVKSTYKKQRC